MAKKRAKSPRKKAARKQPAARQKKVGKAVRKKRVRKGYSAPKRPGAPPRIRSTDVEIRLRVNSIIGLFRQNRNPALLREGLAREWEVSRWQVDRYLRLARARMRQALELPEADIRAWLVERYLNACDQKGCTTRDYIRATEAIGRTLGVELQKQEHHHTGEIRGVVDLLRDPGVAEGIAVAREHQRVISIVDENKEATA